MGKVCDKMFGLMYAEVTVFAAFCPPISVAGIARVRKKRTQGQIKD